jgi:hypothetical protein
MLRGALRALLGLDNPLRTYDVRRLLKSARGGEGLAKLAAEIDAQMPAAQRLHKSTFLLPSWLISLSSARVIFMSVEDLVWAAAYTVRSSRRLQINAVDRFGRHIVISVKDVNAMLQAISSRAPWAVAGPDKEMEEAFGKGKPLGLFPWLAVEDKRLKLIHRVDERRKAILAQFKAQHSR